MKKNIEELKKTKVFALGGLEEVGKNTYCIEHDNSIVIIDSGIKFPDKNLLGVKYVIPDYSYLQKKEKQIKMLLVTHGHEDHIGGIPFLLERVKVPKIYAPKLASDLIRLKLKKRRLLNKTEVIEYDEKSRVQDEFFDITFFRVAHSIPNSFGMAVKTPNGMVVTTGDFKIDLTPLGEKISFDNIQRIAQKGVTLMLSDSTNSENAGHTPTEKEVMKNISNIFNRFKSRIFITTFASNVDRIYEIINIAKRSEKKIIVFGRSIENIISIIQKRKYLSLPRDFFIDKKNIEKVNPEKLIIICTGSQGEANSIVTRFSQGTHELVKPRESDILIFSSRPIPGNRYRIKELVNDLKKKKVDVKSCSKRKILHTSGHANKEDQKTMISLFRPKYFMPMHGEYRMLKIHSETAVEVGVAKENVFLCRNGDEIILEKESATLKRNRMVPPVYISGNKNKEIDLKNIMERNVMLKNGMVGVTISFDQKRKQIISIGNLKIRGISAKNESGILEEKMKESILKETKDERIIEKIKMKAQRIIEDLIFKNKRLTPLIKVEVFSI